MTDAQGNVRGARIRNLRALEDVQARIVIAADGTESQAARWAGPKTVPALADLYACLQALLCAPPGQWMPDVAAQTAIYALQGDDVSASALKTHDNAGQSRYGRKRARLLSLGYL
ncbi:MAG: hypothetical protein ABIQ99_17140 [Thermoflexales bacterium]